MHHAIYLAFSSLMTCFAMLLCIMVGMDSKPVFLIGCAYVLILFVIDADAAMNPAPAAVPEEKEDDEESINTSEDDEDSDRAGVGEPTEGEGDFEEKKADFYAQQLDE